MESIKILLGGIGLVLVGIFALQIEADLFWWIGFISGFLGALLVILGLLVPIDS